MSENSTETTGPKYPDVEVQLSGTDGNAFAILGKVGAALRFHSVDEETIEAFYAEATDGDFDHLLRTAMRWVDVA